MQVTRIEHIGIAVRSLREAIPAFEELLGSPPSAVEEVSGEKVRTVFFEVGESRIELLEPTSPEGPIAKFLERRGEGIHHLSLAVEGLTGLIETLTEKGITPIDREPRQGARGSSIAFLHPKSTHGVLIELSGKP
jgi:methylmalonyl-CoA/ethylmalonyl-CoA epimerase